MTDSTGHMTGDRDRTGDSKVTESSGGHTTGTRLHLKSRKNRKTLIKAADVNL